MKILQNLAKDLFTNKTEVSALQGQTNSEIKTVDSQSVDSTQVQSAQEAQKAIDVYSDTVESTTIEALSEERPLTPEEKKQVKELLKDPNLSRKKIVEALTLMVRKRLPLTAEVLHTVNRGLTTDLLTSDLRETLSESIAAEKLMPTLLKALLHELTSVGGKNDVKLPALEETLDALFFEGMIGDNILESQLEEAFDLNSSGLFNGTKEGAKSDGQSEKSFKQVMLNVGNDTLNLDEWTKLTRGIENEGRNSVAEIKKGADVQREELQSDDETVPLDQMSPHEDRLIQGAIPFDQEIKGKIFLRQEVKEAMKVARLDFDQFRKTTLDQLKKVENLPTPMEQKQVIQKTIEAVDRLLMKSDIPLYTSMKMEKQLLVMSSQLADIKKLVEQGKLSQAKEPLNKIIQNLEAMAFKPSAKKIIYQSGLMNSGLTAASAAFKNQPKGLDLTGALARQITAFSELKGSPRMVLEHLRSLGYNLEGENHQGGKSLQGAEITSKQRTIYEALEALNKDTPKKEDKEMEKEWPKELAQSLGAHRLVNKLEEGSPKQSLDLSIPYRTEQGVFELKVHIEARKQDELLDWENFQMFFVLDTPKNGQIGIGVHTIDRKLSLTFKAESRKVVDQLTPMADALKQSLVGVGYQLASIHYGLLREDNVKKETEDKQIKGVPSAPDKDIASRKGVDIKV